MKITLLLVALALLCSCASRQPCEPGQAAQAAIASGARSPAAPAACNEADYAAAWQQAVAQHCSAPRAWAEGQSGQTADALCVEHGNRLWQEAYHLAQTERALGSRFGQLKLALAQGELKPADKLELIRLEREINAIRGAAQARGWIATEPLD